MKNITLIISLLILCSCAKNTLPEEYSKIDLYDEFWNHVNQNYIFFNHKDIDWNMVRAIYGADLQDESTEVELFQAMELSLLALKDNHSRLITPEGYAKTYDYAKGYETHFSLELILNQYLENDYLTDDGIFYSIYNDILYVYMPKVKQNNSLRNIIRSNYNENLKGMIIDLRENAGGNSNGVPELIGDFVKERTFLGSYVEKSGPGHEENYAPIPIFAEPSDDFHFDKKVVVLCNRNVYSAASYFAAMFKGLYNVQLVGQITGGGAGGASTFQLSNGWLLTVSVSDFLDKEDMSIENGVQVNYRIENTEMDILNGQDKMLEFALDLIQS